MAPEPMTLKQRGKLYYLWKSTGIYIPFADDRKLHTNTQAVTKAEAWVLIRMLLDGVRPTSAYIDSLGRSLAPVSVPVSVHVHHARADVAIRVPTPYPPA